MKESGLSQGALNAKVEPPSREESEGAIEIEGPHLLTGLGSASNGVATSGKGSPARMPNPLS